MKVIQALKKTKQLDRKIEKTSRRVHEWCSYTEDPESPQKPLYDADDIRKMMQQIGDWTAEKARLRNQLHKTNIETKVTFRDRTYTIDELLCRQNILLPGLLKTQKLLSRRDAQMSTFGRGRSSDQKVRVVMQYDPMAREKEIDGLEHEMSELSDLLDIVTLETEVIE